MSLTLAIRNRAPGSRLRQFFWTHPEWWSLVLVAAAWAAIVAHAAAHPDHASFIMPSPDVISPHHTMPGQDIVPAEHVALFPVEFLYWCLMVVAMMVPLVLKQLRWVAFQSFRHRRHRAILIFLVGFLLPWLTIGVAGGWV